MILGTPSSGADFLREPPVLFSFRRGPVRFSDPNIFFVGQNTKRFFVRVQRLVQNWVSPFSGQQKSNQPTLRGSIRSTWSLDEGVPSDGDSSGGESLLLVQPGPRRRRNRSEIVGRLGRVVFYFLAAAWQG